MPRAGLNRAAVVALAVELVDAGPDGLAALSLAAVAARAGVAVPSLYKHVDSLGQLKREVATVAITALTAQLRGGIDEARVRDEEPIRGAARALRSWALAHPGLYRASQHGIDPAAESDTALVTAAAASVALLEEAIGRTDLPDDERTHLVRALRAGLHGFITLETTGGFGLPLDVTASFEVLLDVLITGIR